jgi:Ca2+/Na+ antiporter
MNKTNFRTADLFILITIGIQFVVFLLNYEQSLLSTLFAIIQLVFLITYLVYSIRLRHYFESTVNQENRFYERQFEEIKYHLDGKKLKMGHFLNQKNSVDSIQNMFRHSRLVYTERIQTDEGDALSIDILLVTEKGVFVIQYYDARFILRGDYQQDTIQLQYSDTQVIDIINPLADTHPLIRYIKKLLQVGYEDIKRLMIINNQSYVAGMDTLGDNQDIIKVDDVTIKVKKMIDQSQTSYTVNEIETYDKLIEEKIID